MPANNYAAPGVKEKHHRTKWLTHSYLCVFVCSAPLRSCSGAHLSTSSESSTGSLVSMVTGNFDTADVFTINDDQIEQLEESDTTVEMEPDFSPTVRNTHSNDNHTG